MQDRETQEIRMSLIDTGGRKPVSRRRKINWRAMYKRDAQSMGDRHRSVPVSCT